MCPPLASRQRNGGSTASGWRNSEATWPCRWSTGAERQPPRPGERLRRRQADEERADQPGALRDRDPFDPVEPDPGLAERLAQDGRDELEMPPRRDLRDDPAVLRMQLRLGGDDVGQDLAVVRDDSRGRLVAGRLEPEDQALAGSRTGSAT